MLYGTSAYMWCGVGSSSPTKTPSETTARFFSSDLSVKIPVPIKSLPAPGFSIFCSLISLLGIMLPTIRLLSWTGQPRISHSMNNLLPCCNSIPTWVWIFAGHTMLASWPSSYSVIVWSCAVSLVEVRGSEREEEKEVKEEVSPDVCSSLMAVRYRRMLYPALTREQHPCGLFKLLTCCIWRCKHCKSQIFRNHPIYLIRKLIGKNFIALPVELRKFSRLSFE